MKNTRIISFSNQKGGVGKTSLTVHLAGVINEANYRVLLIDLDPQGNLSSFFIDNIYNLEKTTREMLIDELPSEEAIYKTNFENIDLMPSNITLSDLDAKLAGTDDAQYILQDALEEVKHRYDFILIDCPPSLSRATKMALVASTHFIIPIECQEWAVKGAAQLLAFVESIRKRSNPELSLLGFIINKLSSKRKIESEFNELLRFTYKEQVFETEFKNMVIYTEAVTFKQPINYYNPQSFEAESFRNFFKEILSRG